MEADLFTDSLTQWMKPQRAASIRLAHGLQKNLENLNVRVTFGQGTLVDEHQIRITDQHGKHREIEADYVILATGARPDYLDRRIRE